MSDRQRPQPRGDLAERYERMTYELRRLLDAVAVATPDDDLTVSAADAFASLTEQFSRRAAPLAEQIYGRFPDLPGRGQALVPGLHSVDSDGNRLYGTVRFGYFHHGDYDTVHGGALALFMEDVLSFHAMSSERGVARTAYLHLDYRAATPVGQDLQVAAWFEEEQGRKRFVRGTLRAGETLCLEARALCVAPRSGL